LQWLSAAMRRTQPSVIDTDKRDCRVRYSVSFPAKYLD